MPKDGNAKVALVTGASRGIGRGIAVALAERGWSLAINYNSNKDAANEAIALIGKTGSKGVAIQANISVAADRDRLVNETLTSFGRLDLLVNNAGMAPRVRRDLLEMTEESYDEVMDVNLKGPLFLTQRAAREMAALKKAGRIDAAAIVSISSVSAYAGSLNRGEYCISKAGMGMMTALFADRLAAQGIQVFEIRPGIVETDMTSGAAVKAKYDKMLAEGFTPIARWGRPEDVARAVLAVAEGYFPFSTGEILNVDGGFHLRRL